MADKPEYGYSEYHYNDETVKGTMVRAGFWFLIFLATVCLISFGFR